MENEVTMSAFDRLDSHLQQYFEPAHGWMDDAVDEGARIAGQFTIPDWKRVRQEWKSRPETWQVGPVGTLGEIPKVCMPIARDVLFEMITEGVGSTPRFALYALRRIDDEVLGQVPSPPTLLLRLKELGSCGLKPDEQEVAKILARLGGWVN